MTAYATNSSSTAPAPDRSRRVADGVLAGVKAGQQLTVDAVRMWAKVAAVAPVKAMPGLPGVPALPGVAAVTGFTFDLAVDLLQSQREFTLHLADAVTPADAA